MCFKGSGNITSPSWVVGAWMFIILVQNVNAIIFNVYYPFSKFKQKTERATPLRWPRNGVVLIQIICLAFKAPHDLASVLPSRAIYALTQTLYPARLVLQ